MRKAALFQIGLTCFKFSRNHNDYNFQYNSFSFIVIPYEDDETSSEWAIEPQCLVFLEKNGFDFKDYFKNAIEYQQYTSCPNSAKVKKIYDVTLSDILSKLKEYVNFHHFYTNCFSRISLWLFTEVLMIVCFFSLALLAIYQMYFKLFPVTNLSYF